MSCFLSGLSILDTTVFSEPLNHCSAQASHNICDECWLGSSHTGAGEMTHQLKALAPKPGNLSFIPKIHTVKGELSPLSFTHHEMHTQKCTHKGKKKHYMKTTATKPSTSSGVEDLAVECQCPLHSRPCSKWHVCVVITSERESLSVVCVYFFIVPLCQFVCVHFVVIQRWWGNSVETVTWIIQLPSHITKSCCNHNISNQFRERYTL